MARLSPKSSANFIMPLYMNGLQGRMLHLPASKRKKRNILLVYGHRSSLERWWGLARDLNRYGSVTIPDLPGFGGMQSFYKIGQQPTIDNLADYLAAFVKLRYRRSRVTVIGLSFGFVVVTRMLQRYPDLARKVDLAISVVGFAHHEDFIFSRPRRQIYSWVAGIFSHRLTAAVFRAICLHPVVIRSIYPRTSNARQRLRKLRGSQLREALDYEVKLWHQNDVRTFMKTAQQFLKLDNCSSQVELPLWHVSVRKEQYFDKQLVEQHLRVIFSDFHKASAKSTSHSPTKMAEVTMAAPIIPDKIRAVLAIVP